MFHDQKITRSWRARYSAFFVTKYISKLFELCFMTKKSHGAGEREWHDAFFVTKYISKLFELLFMTKKQQPGSGGVWYLFLSQNVFQNYLNYVSWQKNHTELATGV